MKTYLKRVCDDGQTVNNLFNTLGIEAERITPSECVLRLPVKPIILQGARKVAGGVIATLADEAMAHCVIAGLEDNQTTVTIEMNIRYLRSISEGEMVAQARVVRKGRTIIATEAEVKSESGQLLATAGASFWVGEPR